MPSDLDSETQKTIVKEAIQEWLDCQLIKFSMWSIKGILAIVISGVAYAYATTHGFKL